MRASSRAKRNGASRRYASRTEREETLDRVLPAQVELDAELAFPHAERAGLADVRGRAGNRRENALDELRRLAGRPEVRLELGVSGIAHLQRAPAVAHVEIDRRALDRDDVAEELREIGERAAAFAAIDAGERVELRVGRALVDEDDHPPVALQDVARHERGERDRQPRHVHVVDHALVVVIGDRRPARAVVGVLADPARTKHLAIAYLEYASLQAIAHDDLHCAPHTPDSSRSIG
ncbi:hypothetical protein DM47_2749 [Burkholderia mallei]|nr:hypothetical protein DM49_3542 [Burkholderia mallei]KOT20934.1 hypothetical protein DM47_2749 [Burkholderia mallei]